ncbi:AAA family ATPase [Microbispora sp. H10949]|uniref:AAA family ATPase n=1 Tax=Microbispora sp. H10949 TaxID=2729111 RepID=UPI0015FFB4EB|nr:AAA family ATPase [Microbispora sp. H10949]
MSATSPSTAPDLRTGAIHEIVHARLTRSDLPAAVSELVEKIMGESEEHGLEVRLPQVYLNAVTVHGFRGIGRTARLEIPEGPGLTLVTGRNGSGKSSFAEAVEVALTGENSRWIGKSQVWQTFRNVHEDASAEIELELLFDGDREPSIVRHEWTGAKVDEAVSTITRPGQPAVPLGESGLAGPLALFRPFLPYAELSKVLDKPTGLYENIAKILGLGPVADAIERIKRLVKELDETVKRPAALLPGLISELEQVNDPRAAKAVALLGNRAPDLDQLEALVSGWEPEADSDMGALRRIAELVVPKAEAVHEAAERLRGAAAAVAALSGTSAEDARHRADLLDLALSHHRRHPLDGACPVCATPDRIDSVWAEQAGREVGRLRGEAAAADRAHAARRTAREALLGLLGVAPGWLPEPVGDAWQALLSCRGLTDDAELADRFEEGTERLRLAGDDAATQARERLAGLDETWRRCAVSVASWIGDARAAARASTRLTDAKKAAQWLRAVHDEIRDARMEPHAQEAGLYWQVLRQESNVGLGPIQLTGTGNMRRLQLDVIVDDAPATGLGVMSQGELHALALSLFLPRAATPESPFRFIVIDDPVQSMDPAKVEGLAKALSMVAQTRQVIVFTHDTRLPNAAKQLALPATILEVMRKEGSIVSVVECTDPVSRALRDARDLARTPGVPQDVADTVVPGLCRVALEAAFLGLARRRLGAAGIGYDEIDRKVVSARKLSQISALALFGDIGRSGDVMGWLSRSYGRWAADVYRACLHGAGRNVLRGSGDDPIALVGKLTRKIKEEL